MSSLTTFTTLEAYGDLRRWLQSLQQAGRISEWGDAMRWYIENDLFFLVCEVLSDGRESRILETGQRFYWDQFYVDYCRQVELQEELGGGFDGSARGVGKSTIRTKGRNIRRMIKYPNSAGAIFSFQRKAAKKHYRGIKTELETNIILRTVADDVLFWDPVTAARNGETVWSLDDGMSVKRSMRARKEQSLEYNAFFDGTPTGGRFDSLDFDDIEDWKAVSTPEMLEKLHHTYDATLPVLTPVVLKTPVVMFTNTFYSDAGLAVRVYEQKKAEDPRLVRVMPGEDLSIPGDGPMGGTPMYPFTKERLEMWWKNMQDKREYAVQICCSFRAGEGRVFRNEWLKRYDQDPVNQGRGKNIYICIDPSRGVNDPSVLWAWAVGADKSISWVDCVQKKMDPALPEFFETIFNFVMKWNGIGKRVMDIRVENFGQATYDSQIKNFFRDRGYNFDVVSCADNTRTGRFQTGKRDREFERWARPASEGVIFIPKPLSEGGVGIQRENHQGGVHCLVDYFIKQEWDRFPKPLTDNMLDAGGLIWEPEERTKRAIQYPSVSLRERFSRGRRGSNRTSAMSMG